MSDSRLLPPTPELFRRSEDIPTLKVTGVEGDPFPSPLLLRVLMATEDMECLEVTRSKGFVDPKHRHNDHSTICCLISGRLVLHIADQTFLAEPGDVWAHPPGVEHWSEALEDSTQIEVKSPPYKTW